MAQRLHSIHLWLNNTPKITELYFLKVHILAQTGQQIQKFKVSTPELWNEQVLKLVLG